MKLLLLALLLSACATQQAVIKPDMPKPTIENCAEKSWCWDSLVLDKITDKMLGANVSSFCPNAKKLEGKTVWLNIVKAIAYAESGWSVHNTYTETTMGKDLVTGKQIVSEGLLQLSYADSRNWSSLPACKAIDYEKKNIQDPEVNISCGLAIMDRLAARNPSLDISDTKSLGAYWSSARIGHNASRAKLKQLLPGCSS